MAYGANHVNSHHRDFQIYYFICQHFWIQEEGLFPQYIYDYQEPETGVHYRYAPINAFLMLPLTFFELQTAAVLFFLIQMAALLYSITLVLKWLKVPLSEYQKIGLLAFFVTGGYLLQVVHTGNIHFVALFLTLWAFYEFETGKTWRPALWMGLAIATKVTPLLFLPYLLFKKKFKECLAVIGVLIMLISFPAIFNGIESNMDLLKSWSVSIMNKASEARNHSLHGVLTKYLTADKVAPNDYKNIHIAT